MPNEPKVPDYFSKARACALSGHTRGTIDRWISRGDLHQHGDFRQVSRVELEALIGKPIDMAAWDRATITLNRQALARSEAA